MAPIVSRFFSLKTNISVSNTNLTLQVVSPIVNTYHLPQTHDLLKKYLPNIYKSVCYNDEQLSFSDEVRKTEMGHLFEHILIAYLCEIKMLSGHSKTRVCGETRWDWKKERRGKFNITLNIGRRDRSELTRALSKSVILFTKIHKSHTLTIN